MASAESFLRDFCFGAAIVLIGVTALRVIQNDPNAWFILLPAIFCAGAGYFFHTRRAFYANWLLLFSALLGWVMFLSSPFSIKSAEDIMKFLLLCFPQTLIVILSLRLNGLILFPADITISSPSQGPGSSSPSQPVSYQKPGFIQWLRENAGIISAIMAVLGFLFKSGFLGGMNL